MSLDKTATDVYTSFDGLAKLKAQARNNSPEALQGVAKQFEAVFLKMALKSMREASAGDSLFDSESSLFYREMYDQQLALHLSNNSKIGLADMIVKQLGGAEASKLSGKSINDYRLHPVFNTPKVFDNKQLGSLEEFELPTLISRPESGAETKLDSPKQFVETLFPFANQAARELNVHPGILLAQAALESGWGKKTIPHIDGSSTHNLFGIKADQRWNGQKVAVMTLEYDQGIGRRQQANFRAYDNFADAFQDYVRFIKSNPRYQQALAHADDPHRYIQELQKAGYATDPIYGQKVIEIFDQQGFQRASLENVQAPLSNKLPGKIL